MSSVLPGAGRTRAWHHHGGETPHSPRAILLHWSLLGCVIIWKKNNSVIQVWKIFVESSTSPEIWNLQKYRLLKFGICPENGYLKTIDNFQFHGGVQSWKFRNPCHIITPGALCVVEETLWWYLQIWLGHGRKALQISKCWLEPYIGTGP